MYLPIESYPEAFRRACREHGVKSAQFAADVFPFWEAGQKSAIASAFLTPPYPKYTELDLKPRRDAAARQQLAADILRALVAGAEFYDPAILAKRAVETADALLGALQ